MTGCVKAWGGAGAEIYFRWVLGKGLSVDMRFELRPQSSELRRNMAWKRVCEKQKSCVLKPQNPWW
jgi:hypothetical protein